jgi:hypothetical protein
MSEPVNPSRKIFPDMKAYQEWTEMNHSSSRRRKQLNEAIDIELWNEANDWLDKIEDEGIRAIDGQLRLETFRRLYSTNNNRHQRRKQARR